MSDFHQFGLISTLHRIGEDASLEDRLEECSQERPVGLILPCHFHDLQQPAMQGILSRLAGASFLRRLILVTNGGGETGREHARNAALGLPVETRVLAADCEPLASWLRSLSFPVAQSKGLNLWLGIGTLLHSGPPVHTIAAHDCDIVDYQRELLVRLCLPVTDPELDYAFAKGYYRRASGRLYGRVSRLFMIPLLQALVRVLGHSPLLDFVESFRYPLAGELAMARGLAEEMPSSMDWGLETGMLADVFQKTDPALICQVDLGAKFEHKHQPLGEADASTGLARMCREIAATIFSTLEREGIALNSTTLSAVCDSYESAAARTLKRYEHVARFNRMEPAQDESGAVNVFGAALRTACNPAIPRAPALPGWNQLARAKPDTVRVFSAILDTCQD